MLGYDKVEQANEGGMKSTLLHVGDTMDPDEVNAPKSPDGLVGTAPNIERGGGAFDKVDNSWGWISFS